MYSYLGYLDRVLHSEWATNIDYAIRHRQPLSGSSNPKMHHRDAIVETLNFAFPTIITSGSILSICGFLDRQHDI